MDSDLLLICQQLHAKKLKPSVALLRARSNHSLPIPKAVKAVQEWEHMLKNLDPQMLSTQAAATSKGDVASKSHLITRASLEKRLTAAEKELTSIKLALEQLT